MALKNNFCSFQTSISGYKKGILVKNVDLKENERDILIEAIEKNNQSIYSYVIYKQEFPMPDFPPLSVQVKRYSILISLRPGKNRSKFFIKGIMGFPPDEKMKYTKLIKSSFVGMVIDGYSLTEEDIKVEIDRGRM